METYKVRSYQMQDQVLVVDTVVTAAGVDVVGHIATFFTIDPYTTVASFDITQTYFIVEGKKKVEKK